MIIFNNKSNVNPVKIPYVDEYDIETESYNIIKGIEQEGFVVLRNHIKSSYVAMKEHSLEILEESFKDSINDVIGFFKRLITKIIEFVKNAIKYFISFIGDFEKFLKDNQEDISKLDPNYSTIGYNYSYPFNNVPILDKVNDIVDNYNTDIDRIDQLSVNEIRDMKNTFLTEESKSKIRQSILGSSKYISDDDFLKACKVTFRGSAEPVEIKIDKNYVAMILDRFGSLKKALNDTEKDKIKVVKLLNDLEIFFEKKVAIVYKDDYKYMRTNKLVNDDNTLKKDAQSMRYYDSKRVQLYNAFFEYKFIESRFISNVVTNVYLEKVNALKDCMNQYKKIIRSILHTKSKTSDEKNSSKAGEMK